MTVSSNHLQTLREPGRRADRVGRGLMAFNAVLTLVPLVAGIAMLSDVPGDYLITEAWRSFAYLVFAGLWAIIAIWPRRQPGVWELLLAQKAAITVFALANGSVAAATQTAAIDGWLVLSTAFAYVLCRGWLAWRRFRAQL